MRVGVAEIMNSYIKRNDTRDLCCSVLGNLFYDDDVEVRKTASICFGSIDADEINSYVELIQKLTISPAFEYGCFHLIHKLHESNACVPDVICDVCEHYLVLVGNNIANIQSMSLANTDEVIELVVRMYFQTQDPVIQKRCLDMLDKMLENGLRDCRKHLETFDR